MRTFARSVASRSDVVEMELKELKDDSEAVEEIEVRRVCSEFTVFSASLVGLWAFWGLGVWVCG